MALTKGTDVVALRDLLRTRGAAVEQAAVAAMDSEARHLYQTVLASAWSPVEVQMRVYQAAAATLCPGAREPMAELGRLLAAKAYGGIYRVFLLIPTVHYVMGKTAQLWRTYYDSGQASIENAAPTSLDVVVRDFPELPAPMREMAAGHMAVLVERTGARQPTVTRDDRVAAAWRWHLRWS